ncbi:TraX family protein [Acutalibacter caecimuris]|uniref:TraX family protein n=1 Tax=Acutalibacter caecimuris TaxID=3093657 RepID=UPI002AC9E7AC|nr:TraX family protein [Acutalibacter sp. M00118]
MTSAVLQLIAVSTMFIDHVGYRLYPGVDLLRMIGRLSFPVFAFMLVEGFIHTANRGKYVQRLALFAVASEAPYQLFARGRLGALPPWSNIFFELLLIFFALWLAEAGKWYGWLGAAGVALLAEWLGCMYGAYGVLVGLGFYAFRDRRWAGMSCLVACTLLCCLYHGSWFQIYAGCAAVPLWLYNGQRGRRLPRYFCYAFYPAHLLLIWGVSLLR